MPKVSKSKNREKFTVVKSISLDLDLLNAIRDEAGSMSKTFSEATSILVRMGIYERNRERDREEEAERNNSRLKEEKLTHEEKHLLGG